MNQFRLLEPQQADEQSRELLEAVQSNLGRLPNMFKAMANSPVLLNSYNCLTASLDSSSLSSRLREQIALIVSEINSCEYCLSAHTAISKMLGMTNEDITDSRLGRSDADDTAAVLAFVASLVNNHGQVSDEDLENIQKAGINEKQIGEIVLTVIVTILTNYFNLAARTPVDFPKVEPLTNVA